MTRELTLATWNVNSLRARQAHVHRFLVECRPEIVCFQETKVTDDEFPLTIFTDLGYEVVFTGQKSYNGVAICSVLPLNSVYYGFDNTGGESEKRLIAATIGGIRVVNAYIPNGGQVDSDKFADKLTFYEDLRDYLAREHNPDQPLALVGDYNVAPEPRDVFDPVSMDGQTCFHPKERSALDRLCQWGLSDAFRQEEPGSGHYSWWDYRQGAWERDMGMRIDHIMITQPLKSTLAACWMEREERAREKASDHIPVMATFNTP